MTIPTSLAAVALVLVLSVYAVPSVHALDTQSTGTGIQTQSTGSGGKNVTLINPLNSGDCTPNGDCLMAFLNKILDLVIRIGSIAVILMLVWVGYLFVVAQGNGEKIAEARHALLWTLIGALILLGAKAISFGIEATVKALSVGK